MSTAPEAPVAPAEYTEELLRAVSPAYRLTRQGLRIDGVPFDLSRMPFLYELYQEVHPKIVLRKAAQLGATVWAIMTVIERARTMYPRGVLYAFPTDDEVFDFSQSRFDRILKDNPAYQELVTTTDRTTLKKIGDIMLYFRGMRAKSKLLSIPVDLIVFDEYDEMEPSMVQIALQRISGSDYGHWIKLGHPTIPGYMIDLDWERSDKRHWMIKCQHCGAYTCLEDEFPECVVLDGDLGGFRACSKCRKEIHVGDGEWVAKEPDRSQIRGYWISQLMSPTKTPRELIDDYEECLVSGRGMQTFYNLSLGMPYADLDQAMTQAQVRELCNPEQLPVPRHEGPCFLGADVGKKKIHVTVGYRPFGVRRQILNWYIVDTFNDLKDIGKRFNVQCGVIDAMAESRKVREFCRTTYWAWGCWYSRHQKKGYDWNVKTKQVTTGRTECLDAAHNAMVGNTLGLPRASKLFDREVVKQLVNLARMVHEDEKTGQQTAVWIVRGSKNDHFRHAISYAMMASERIGMSTALMRKQRSIRNQRDAQRLSAGAQGWMGG